MNGQLSSGLCPFPQTQHIHPCPKSKTYLSISPPPAIFLNQNSSSFYTENYCLMLTGMRYRRFASTDSNGPLCSTWAIEQFKLKNSEFKKKKKWNKPWHSANFCYDWNEKETKQESIPIPNGVTTLEWATKWSGGQAPGELRDYRPTLQKSYLVLKKKKKIDVLRVSISSSFQWSNWNTYFLTPSIFYNKNQPHCSICSCMLRCDLSKEG